MYGWKASWTTLVYTTHIHSTCTKVGSDASRIGEKEYASIAAPLASSACSPSCPPIDWAVYGGGEAGPAPSQSFRSAPGTQQRSKSSRLRLRPTYESTLANRTAILAANPAKCRDFGHHLGGGDGWRRLPAFRGPNRVVFDRHRSVEEQSEALSACVRERVC